MWNQNQKQNNEIYRGQMTGSYRLPGHHDENHNAARSNVSGRDFLGETSRKRKLVDYCGHAASGANSEIVFETKWSSELSHQDTFGVLSNINEQGSSMRGISNVTPYHEAGEKLYQPGGYQSHGRINYELNSKSNQTNAPNAVVDTRDNPYSTTQPHAIHQNGPSSLIKAPAAKIPTLPNPQSVSFTFLNQFEVPKHSYPDQTATTMDKSVPSMNGVNFGHIYNSVKGNSSLNLSFKTSEVLSSSEASQDDYRMFSSDVNLGERNLTEDIRKTRSSFEMRCNDEALDVTQTMATSVFGTSSTETARLEGNVTKPSFQNYLSDLRVGTVNNIVTSQVKPIDQIDGKYGTQNMEGKERSPTRNENHSLWENVSLKDSGNPTYSLNGTRHGDDSQHVASKLDEESKSYSEKASSITEKLWDGSLQLSTSGATVSAVAFFKSGEKAPEINWSESIVVKGKVRLEAFEKFIQELPRSRSRGLMVTSLCWRAGSSKTGLTYMKEVAKGYKERDKVGYAQISRGIDLYVCPRSDAIITILAKYGFFKGMAVLEMDQDSLIGCVVWRRNQPSSDSIIKKSQNENFPSSDEPLNSTSNPIVSQTERPDIPFRHPEERFSPIVSKNSYAPHTVPGCSSILTGNNQIEVGNSASTAPPEKIHVAQQSSTSVTAALSSAILSVSHSLNSYMSSQVETPILQSSGPEKPHSGLELPRLIRPVSPQTVTIGNREAPADDNDDDDLPEFDFGTACGISQHSDGKGLSASKEVHAVPPRKEVPDEGAHNTSGSMPSSHPNVQSTVITSQPNPQQGSQKNAFRGVSGVSQSSHSGNEIGEGEYSQPALASSNEKPKARGAEHYGQPGIDDATNVKLRKRKSMWDDDDDMPEWCPPDLEHRGKPDMMSSTWSSVPCVPPSPYRNSNQGKPEMTSTTRHSVPPSPYRNSNQGKPEMTSTTRHSVPPSPYRNSSKGKPEMMSTTRHTVPPSPYRNSNQGKPEMMSTPRHSVPPSPYRNSNQGKPEMMSTTRHSVPPSPYRNSHQGKPEAISTTRHSVPPSPYRNSHQGKPETMSTIRHSVPPSPYRNSHQGKSETMSTTRHSVPPSPYRNSHQGKPETMSTTRHSVPPSPYRNSRQGKPETISTTRHSVPPSPYRNSNQGKPERMSTSQYSVPPSPYHNSNQGKPERMSTSRYSVPPSPYRNSNQGKPEMTSTTRQSVPPSPYRNSNQGKPEMTPTTRHSVPPSPYRNSNQGKPEMLSTTRPSVPCIPPSPLRNSNQGKPEMMSTNRSSVPSIPLSPLRNSNPDQRLPGPPPTMATTMPYTSSSVPSWKSENMSPGPPPTISTTRPPSPFTSSSVPSWKSENMPPGPPPPPPPIYSSPSSSYMPPPTPTRNSQNIPVSIPIPIPIPPPTTSKPSFSYISSPAPRQKSENTLPGPPPLPSLPPPLPLPFSDPPQFQTQGLSLGFQSSITTDSRPQNRHVSIQPPSPSPSWEFTYHPTSRPQADTFDVRPSVWRDWRP